MVVDYRGEQFVVALKIRRGNAYQKREEQQLAEYLDYFGLEKGYMPSFNFNQKKETGVRHVQAGGRLIVEAVV